ncbi:hypothetical protein [uncultured Croceitalea sp.]|uniref:hypothetical protein n=1 Tax=uncultured Croceitalea sp. TaxID=1798908 RepID=UPI00374FA9FA
MLVYIKQRGSTAATAYSFKVRALDAAGNESADSNTLTLTTNATSGSGGSTEGDILSKSGDNVSLISNSDNLAVGRSTVPNGYKLAVEGNIRTREIRVDQDTWPDYVFDEDYILPSLEEIQKHIKEKGHLPNIPSAKEVKATGIELGKMNKLLLEKIEELTLYILQQEGRIKELERRN